MNFAFLLVYDFYDLKGDLIIWSFIPKWSFKIEKNLIFFTKSPLRSQQHDYYL